MGGSSSGLRQGRPAAPVATAPRRIEKVVPIGGPTHQSHLKQVKKNNALLYIGAAAVGMIVIIVVIVVGMYMMRPPEPGAVQVDGGAPGGKAMVPGHTPPAGEHAGGGNTVHEPGPAPGEAVVSEEAKGFIGVPLVGKKIVLSIDGASSMADSFSYVCRGVYHAVDGLEPGQQVRVVVWRGNKVKLIPESGFVDKSGVKQLREQLDAIAVTGSSEAVDCMKESVEQGGDQVVFVTAKYGLDSSIADAVLAAKKGDVRFDGVKIESEDPQSPLEILAKKSGGTYRVVSTGKLDQLTR
jgi:hypothetical protein